MKTFFAITAALLFVAAPQAYSADEKTVAETAMANKDFSTLVAAVKAAGLVEALNAKGPITVFAPTNAAFAKIPQDKLDALLKDKEALAKVLKLHIVEGNVMAADVMKMDGKMVNGLPIKANDKGVWVGTSMVTKTDIKCSNGVIHVIDTVLMPPTK